MHSYLARRLLLVIPTLLGVTIVVFSLVRLLPGDAVSMLQQDYAYGSNAEELRARLGLDRPVQVQYFEWLGNVARGDLGTSLRTRQPVSIEIFNRLPVTAEVGGLRSEERRVGKE